MASIVGAFHVFDAGRNGHRAAQMRADAGQAGEFRKRIEREIHFAGRAADTCSGEPFEEIGGQIARSMNLQESEIGIDAGGNDVGANFFAAFEDHASRRGHF